MELLVQRHDNEGDACSGDFFIDHVYTTHTLEDVVRPDGDKVYGRTAIPPGRYKVELINSPRFGEDTMAVRGVPGFEDIRIHGGNKPEDTLGCPLVGDELEHTEQGPRITGGTSQPALHRVKALVVAAVARGEHVWLTVQNPS